ncbi:hypothetical protein CIT292_11208 [Citrobacter youngae ATCC 29220]|uniref:Uncharacterized protein n=1 Tax=Citrobacter youngae ATCC 29220 TaxID=500640 RepID=D4BKX8_9ENTR|nr:hypothetical protein CIT292_11208 [Citrobacter youngae ATCC 29220]
MAICRPDKRSAIRQPGAPCRMAAMPYPAYSPAGICRPDKRSAIRRYVIAMNLRNI